MKRAHETQRVTTWVILSLLMAALAVGCILASDLGFRAALRARATAKAEWPLGIVSYQEADLPLADGVTAVSLGKNADGETVGYLVTVVSEGQGATTCTVVISADGKTLGGVRAVSGSTGGRYYNIRAALPYFTDQFEEVPLPVSDERVDLASGATGSSMAVVENIRTAAAFVSTLVG